MRKCGTCSVCCLVLGIHELGKNPGERCWRQTGKGCSIYATRPRVCRDWRCLWLQGRYLEAERPDRVGFLVAEVPPPARFTVETGLALFNAFRAVPGKLPEAGQELFDKIARKNIVTLDGRVYGPPAKLPKALEWLDREAAAEKANGT